LPLIVGHAAGRRPHEDADAARTVLRAAPLPSHMADGEAITMLAADDFTYIVTHALAEGLVTCTEITRRRRASD